jgi:hypothetical protein
VFSAPLWLLGLATLAIPLALHLWSRRPKRLIRVGSLRHVAGLAEARSWAARLSEPLLLAVRLAFLTAVVLALAGPLLPVRFYGRSGELVLVDPGLLMEPARIRSDALLDSLARSRATVRLLLTGLPKIQLDGYRSPFPVPRFATEERGTRNTEPSLWDLLVEADQLVAPGDTIEVIARPRPSTLGGRRPRLHAAVAWHVPQDPGPRSWVVAEWQAPGDSLWSLTGRGDATQTEYSLSAGLQRLGAPASSGPTCPRCMRPPVVRIATVDSDTVLARRLGIAARAVAAGLGQKLLLNPSSDSADLLLTSGPLTDALVSQSRPVLSLAREAAWSPAAADTLWARWPWQPLARDSGDPRLVSAAQALPAPATEGEESHRPMRSRLFILAALLLLIERWLATRPTRRAT